jgi:oxygen-dependent protoporphyrinogen oxidase
MLAGIYAADPEKLSLLATFPQLRDMERKGGLVRGMLARNGGGKRPSGGMTFMTLRRGLGSLASALAERLGPRIKTGTAAESLIRRGAAWQACAAGQTLEADAVVSALPAWATAELVEAWDVELAGALREIPFASSATASFVFDASALGGGLRGSGFLVPAGQGTVSAASYSSIKFPGRAASGRSLIRCFVGGAGREAALRGGVSAIERSALEDLRRILALPGLSPLDSRVHLWTRANPQYAPGHGLLLRRIESCLRGHPGLLLAGCSYRGIGLPDCVRSGREAGRMAAGASVGAPRAAAGLCV